MDAFFQRKEFDPFRDGVPSDTGNPLSERELNDFKQPQTNEVAELREAMKVLSSIDNFKMNLEEALKPLKDFSNDKALQDEKIALRTNSKSVAAEERQEQPRTLNSQSPRPCWNLLNEISGNANGPNSPVSECTQLSPERKTLNRQRSSSVKNADIPSNRFNLDGDPLKSNTEPNEHPETRSALERLCGWIVECSTIFDASRKSVYTVLEIDSHRRFILKLEKGIDWQRQASRFAKQHVSHQNSTAEAKLIQV